MLDFWSLFALEMFFLDTSTMWVITKLSSSLSEIIFLKGSFNSLNSILDFWTKTVARLNSARVHNTNFCEFLIGIEFSVQSLELNVL